MTAGTADGPPTLGQITYETFTAVRYHGSLTTAWTSPRIAHKAWEAAGAAVGAAAIARLDTPAKLCAAMAENVRLRRVVRERDAQLADALTPTAGDFDHAAEIMRLRDACEAEIASLTDQRNRVSDTADIVRRQLRAVKAIADQHALGDSPRAILAQSVLDQLDADL